MVNRPVVGIAIGLALAVGVFVGLRNRGSQPASQEVVGPKAQNAERSIFALDVESAKPGGETHVRLRSLPTAGTIVTMIGELNYDPERLQLKRCVLNPSIGEPTSDPDEQPLDRKALHVGEPQPGMLRAVVAGTLDPLPSTAELFTCTFAVRADAAAGPVVMRAHGEVADTTFEDRSFSAEGTVTVEN